MYGPPCDSDDDDVYDGFSFGNEFDDDYESGHSRRTIIRRDTPPISDAEYRDCRFLNCIIEGNENDLLKYINLYCDNNMLPSFNINQPLKQGFNLMLYACQYGRSKFVEILLDFGADPNSCIESVTPLIQACKNTDCYLESFEIVNILLKCGVSVNQSDRWGVTPLMHAAAGGNIEIVNHFIKFADIELTDNEGCTALFHAVENNQIEVVRLLLAINCETNLRNNAGYTPKQIAEFNSFKEILQLFPVDNTYVVPTKYLSIDEYADLAPTAFDNKKPIFFPDVYSLLIGMQSEEFLPKFAEEFVGLPELLNITDERLIELGVKYPFQRKRVQLGLWKFHQRPWSPWTVKHRREINYISMHELYCIFACHVKHLIIMNESVKYVYLNINERFYGTVNDDIREKIKIISKEIKGINILAASIKERVEYLERFNTPKPPLFIEAMQSTCNDHNIISILKYTTLAAGIFLYYFLNRR